MEVELILARRAGLGSALLSIEALPPKRSPELAARVLAALEERLRAAPGIAPIYLLRDTGRLHALLPGRDLDGARRIAEELVAGARHLRPAGIEGELRVSLSVGLALDEPVKNYWLDTLLAVAAEGVLVARARGGEGVAHTELYSLCQRKIEQGHPRPPVVIPPQFEARAAAAPPATHSPATASVPAPRPTPRGFDSQPGAWAVEQPDASADTGAPAPFPPVSPPHEPTDEVLATREREHKLEVERLERRIAKLLETLDTTERELREAIARQGEEHGVASRWTDATGVRPQDAQYQVKAALMERILEANLELRELLRLQRESTR